MTINGSVIVGTEFLGPIIKNDKKDAATRTIQKVV